MRTSGAPWTRSSGSRRRHGMSATPFATRFRMDASSTRSPRATWTACCSSSTTQPRRGRAVPDLRPCGGRARIRLVTYSRPGFGVDAARGPKGGDCAADVALLADHLDAERFLVAGWSGGGPHALACAALMPERVMAAATVAGVAPYDADGLEWTAGMGRRIDRVPARGHRPRGPPGLDAAPCRGSAVVTAAEIVESLRSLVSPVDEASLSGELGEVQAASFRAAFRDGLWGGGMTTWRSSPRGDSTSPRSGFPPRFGRATTISWSRGSTAVARRARPRRSLRSASRARAPVAGDRRRRRHLRRSARGRRRRLARDPSLD